MEFRAGANLFAYLVLVAFVPLAVVVFGRVRPSLAAATLALAGCLFLPELAAFDLELMPALGKENITYLAILLGALLHRPRVLASAGPGRGPEALLLLMALGNVGTVWSNPEPVFVGPNPIPGLTAYAAVSMTLKDLMRFALPFFLGRALFRTEEELRDLMTVVAAAGLVYGVFVVAEIALSGVFRVFQFGQQIYGTFTAIPEWRYGGIRPVVFMMHPLALSIFVATSVIAAAGLAKARLRVFGLSATLTRALLLIVLLLCRNVASVIFGFSMAALIAFARPRSIATVALGLSLFVCVYPALRLADLFPRDQIVALAEAFDPERARSLAGRFDEEEEVLRSTRDRLWLGWGEYSRIRANEEGLDGYYNIESGVVGILGMELRLAMLLLPVVVAWRAQPHAASARGQQLLAALMVMLAVRAVDMIPNGWWTNLPVFLAGALFGVSRAFTGARVGRAVPGLRSDPAAPTRVAPANAAARRDRPFRWR
jgi:hypothetical protein